MRFLILALSLTLVLALSAAPAQAADRQTSTGPSDPLSRGSGSSPDGPCLDETETLRMNEDRNRAEQYPPDPILGTRDMPQDQDCQDHFINSIFSDWQAALSALLLFFLTTGTHSISRRRKMSLTNFTHTFSHSTQIRAPLSAVLKFHEDPKALARLTPPPVFVRVNQDSRTSLTSGELDFTLWMGPIPIRWVAEHQPGSHPSSFIDEMKQGPMAVWVHEHSFEETPTGVLIEDRVTYQYPPGWRGLFSRVMFNRFNLKLLFYFRHYQTRQAIIQESI